jgi:hypothetical protein
MAGDISEEVKLRRRLRLDVPADEGLVRELIDTRYQDEAPARWLALQLLMEIGENKEMATTLATVTAERDAARGQVVALVAALKLAEWGRLEPCGDEEMPACPDCQSYMFQGHKSDCAIGAALSAQPQAGEAHA